MFAVPATPCSPFSPVAINVITGAEALVSTIFLASSPICKFIVGVDLDVNDMFISLATSLQL